MSYFLGIVLIYMWFGIVVVIIGKMRAGSRYSPRDVVVSLFVWPLVVMGLVENATKNRK